MERCATTSETDLDTLLRDKNSKNTNLSTENSWSVFTSYLKAKLLQIDVENISRLEMNDNIVLSIWEWGWKFGHIIKQILHTVSNLISLFISPR